MNITYCWTAPSGYLSACMSELAARQGINASLILWESSSEAPFDEASVSSPRQHVLSESNLHNYAVIKKLVLATRPDVVFIVGWAHFPYVRLVYDNDLRGVRFVIGVDTPIRFDWRQQFARLKIGRLLAKVDAVCVPGERSFQVMRYWKVPGAKISKLFYGVNYNLFSTGSEVRWTSTFKWPRSFVFVGRYVPIKGVDVLVEAYQMYRQRVADPWELSLCGTGPLATLLSGVEGVRDLGFVQPADLGEVFRRAGVFVLPSRLDPWGQAIVEAAAAGLPIVCTQACGASAEMVRDYHNGIVVPPNDVESLASAFVWMHEHEDRLPAMGKASQQLAGAYSAERWADNQIELARRLCDPKQP